MYFTKNSVAIHKRIHRLSVTHGCDDERAKVDDIRFSEKFLSFLFCAVYIIKAICDSYQDYAQTSVCMITIAMETLTNRMKMSFLRIFDI